jgi:glutamine---fructose-6-phosphate transaminase (isomerizing)
MSLYQEIQEQPAVLRAGLVQNQAVMAAIAAATPAAGLTHVVVAARGTSDNAARYANYLWGAANRLPVTLASPSLFSLYGQPPRLRDSLVVGISQSGQSPDIVGVLAEGRRQGQPTVAITNAPDSPLAQAADYVVDIGAGVETAVAATKSYTAQLLAIAMLSVAWRPERERALAAAELAVLPDQITALLALDEQIAQFATRYRYMQQCVVLGRGYNYATAFEWALKIKELAYVVAEPYSSADFRHGPIAIVEPGFPVLAVAPSGGVQADMAALLKRLRTEHGAELLVVSDEVTLLATAVAPVPIPAGLPEWLSPLAYIVPAQLFCYHLTRLKGYDTEFPRGLRKITRTE